jgi:hypothetical protein
MMLSTGYGMVLTANKKPRSLNCLGLVGCFTGPGYYIRMVPELAACQAQDIIMRAVPLFKPAFSFQFGTMFLL